MSKNLQQAGVRLLNALSRHSDIIMQAYLTGGVDESQVSPKVLDQLKTLNILWRPEPDADLRLKSAVRNLLEAGLNDERNRHINANIGSAIAALTTLSQHYKEALHNQRFEQAQAHLNNLTEQVYVLTDMLSNGVRVLFGRINNEFGYVDSLDAKIRENELAQSQVSDLLNQLEMIRFDELVQVAGSDRDLRHLLVVVLQNSFARCTQELAIVQAKLLELLGRFREYRGRTRLLKGFLLHSEQQPDFVPSDYTKMSAVPALFNVAQSMIQSAAVDVLNSEHELDLQSIVSSIRDFRHLKKAQPERSARNIKIEEQQEVALDEDKLSKAVDAYFCEVIESGAYITALDYHHQQQLEFEPEAWLYQVIGGYEGLPEEEQRYFAMDALGEPHPIYNGNYLISDVVLGLR
ncbi:phosphoenolpyruvate carboxylase [Planctobacterium marinum]|uniref:Phosphoenolpyruvate carboxylase n=1 Tax=Planctobacterium marinum TaxID=1631968 RepID=A0AA48I9M2_9ALTE|nr:hypothetical protein MACH26_40110 [Planctobacterium marinum]